MEVHDIATQDAAGAGNGPAHSRDERLGSAAQRSRGSGGRVKKALGELTDDEKKKREGTADKARGTLKDIEGDIKRKIDPDKP